MTDKKSIAARVAAELQKDSDVEVTQVKGGLGELSVVIDGQKVVDSNRLWYPRPQKIIGSVRAHLKK